MKKLTYYIIPLIILGIAFFSIISSANEKYNNSKNTLIKLTKEANGKINFEKEESFDLNINSKPRKITLLNYHDNKFNYSVFSDTNEIAVVKPNKEHKEKIKSAKGNLSKSQALDFALKYLSEYTIPNSNINEYKEEKYYLRKDSIYDVHVFEFYGTTSKGIRTGDIITIWVNQKGDLYRFEKINGNAEIAINQSIKITKEEAIKIVLTDLKKKSEEANEKLKDNNIPNNKTDLMVFEDKLAYTVELKHLHQNEFEGLSSYYYVIDALSGKILFSDSTK